MLTKYLIKCHSLGTLTKKGSSGVILSLFFLEGRVLFKKIFETNTKLLFFYIFVERAKVGLISILQKIVHYICTWAVIFQK